MPRLRHALPACLLACFLTAVLVLGQARAAGVANFQDQWWNAAESGWGAAVLQQSDTLFVCFFVYDPDGRPTWFVAVATAQPAPPAGHTVFSGKLYATTGPYFGGPFTGAAVVEREAGTFSFDAGSATAAVIRYVVDGIAVEKAVTRQTWTYANIAGSYYGGTSGEQASCGADNGRREGETFIELTHGSDHSVTLKLADPQGRDWTVTGTYTQSGHLGRITGSIADPSRGWTGSADFGEIEVGSAGITGRGHVVWQHAGATTCVWDGRWGGVRRQAGSGVVSGKVADGTIADALVCLDQNRNGRCDAGEAQARSDASGAYRLPLPKNATGPLVAEVVAGLARDAQLPGTTVDVSYRMASPAAAYSTNITPYTTLVHLTARSDLRLAEDLARNELGLPPKFNLTPATPPAAGSLTRAVANSIVAALKATSATLDMASPAALATVVAAFPPSLTTLPTLAINTRGGAPILSKEIYIDATFELTNPMLSTVPVHLDGQIRGRGHSTWGQPKNPYRVKFADDASLAALADVLGMPPSRHWALLADWFDRSLIRNKLAYSLGSSSAFSDGIKWTPSGQHVEVTLNGDYVGVYLLTETIRIDPARLAIEIMNKDPAADDVDGGYIVEIDHHIDEGWADCYKHDPIDLQHVTPRGVPICLDTPNEEDVTVPQLAYVKGFLDTVEDDIYERGSMERINPASFGDWYLINELFRNQDARWWSSVYLWKDSAASANPADRLLNLGPIWDFDRSAGNVDYDNNWQTEGCWVGKDYTVNWLTPLLAREDFLLPTMARWQQKRAAIGDFVNASIDAYARRLQAAQQRNFARWPILGVHLVNYYTFATWAEEVAFVKSFLNERLAWLDRAYSSVERFNAICR